MIGYIYRIQHIQSDLCYVGSTFNQVKYRWSQHKDKFHRWLHENGPCAAMIYPHMRDHGVDQFKCFLIKEYDVIDRVHLEAYETLWIKKLKACNKNLPFAIKKMTDKAAYAKDRENRCAKVKEYAAANKELIAQRTRAYREKDKDILREKKAKQYTCACSGKYQEAHKQRHFRTKKHQQWLANQS
jgi:hypothetical protein